MNPLKNVAAKANSTYDACVLRNLQIQQQKARTLDPPDPKSTNSTLPQQKLRLTWKDSATVKKVDRDTYSMLGNITFYQVLVISIQRQGGPRIPPENSKWITQLEEKKYRFMNSYVTIGMFKMDTILERSIRAKVGQPQASNPYISEYISGIQWKDIETAIERYKPDYLFPPMGRGQRLARLNAEKNLVDYRETSLMRAIKSGHVQSSARQKSQKRSENVKSGRRRLDRHHNIFAELCKSEVIDLCDDDSPTPIHEEASNSSSRSLFCKTVPLKSIHNPEPGTSNIQKKRNHDSMIDAQNSANASKRRKLELTTKSISAKRADLPTESSSADTLFKAIALENLEKVVRSQEELSSSLAELEAKRISDHNPKEIPHTNQNEANDPIEAKHQDLMMDHIRDQRKWKDDILSGAKALQKEVTQNQKVLEEMKSRFDELQYIKNTVEKMEVVLIKLLEFCKGADI